MALLLHVPRDPQLFVAEFRRLLPSLEVRVWPDIGDPAEIEFAAVCRIPEGVLGTLPRLRFVASLLAGLEHLVSSPEIPAQLPIVRTGSEGGDPSITEYVLLHVLRHHRQMPAYALAQQEGIWRQLPQPAVAGRTVGFLGLGVLGRPAARAVRDMGFPVMAWTRSPRAEPGIDCYSGQEGLAGMLPRTQILVNMLAATAETENIVDARLLGRLPAGAQFINVARGQHVVDADLIAALDSGQLAAATLDVFRTEPLPAQDPLWRHPKITIMPHVARKLRAEEAVPSVIENILRATSGQPLAMMVDRQRGY